MFGVLKARSFSVSFFPTFQGFSRAYPSPLKVYSFFRFLLKVEFLYFIYRKSEKMYF